MCTYVYCIVMRTCKIHPSFIETIFSFIRKFFPLCKPQKNKIQPDLKHVFLNELGLMKLW